MDLAALDLPPTAHATSEAYLRSAELIGRRVAGARRALAAEERDPSFTPEPTVPLYLRASYQSLRNLERRTMRTLRRSLPNLPRERDRQLAEAVLGAVAGGLRAPSGDHHHPGGGGAHPVSRRPAPRPRCSTPARTS